jgi:putative transposase
MPREARLDVPGALVHVITRFVDHEFRIDSEAIRREYLDRLSEYLSRADWIWLAFAIMSSHIHLALLAGAEPLSRWIAPLDTWLAQRLNRVQGRHGPVFQERPTTLSMPRDRADRLIPYLHNNPLRAGLAAERENPLWTSHAFYAGIAAPPAALSVESGLGFCGFGSDSDDREAFVALVDARASEGRDETLSGDSATLRRAATRLETGAPVELTSPQARPDGLLQYGIVEQSVPIRPLGLSLSPETVIALVGSTMGVAPAEMASRNRTRAVVSARRVAVNVWRRCSRPMVEIGAALGLGRSAVSRLLYRGRAEDLEDASVAAAAIVEGLYEIHRRAGGARPSATVTLLAEDVHL